jgi:hypothetical protein
MNNVETVIMDIQNVNDLKIIVNEDSLEPTTFGNTICGELYWQFKEQFFPEENWSDLVSEMFLWWTERSILLIKNLSNFEQFYYMDGPCRLDIRVIKNDFLIECYNEAISWSPIIICKVKPYIMSRKLLLASTRFLTAYKPTDTETESVRRTIEAIKNNCIKIKYLLHNPSGTILIDDYN